ncbi:SDR family oxidoreductase [Streptomyces sp. NBC_00287]|uniref:SDR family NAD(P)-dependent oxidoreductase n=1 Tax=Streptomyces sp. NBC_00287 TaxID=2975702 RepID=UPI002E2C76D0|nr:SDR family NAD(P)-dependent oxidoreductase [Streptomyces sp. NBC_00287]
MNTGLRGRSVVLAGAGSDVGRATAVRLAESGARVLVTDLRRARVERTLKAVTDAGGTGTAVVGDLSDQRVAEHVTDTALDVFGGVDVLVNSSTITDGISALGETEIAEWYRVLEVNLTAPFLLTRAVLPHMLAAGRGSVVFALSGACPYGSGTGTARTAADHGVMGLVRSLADRYRGSGVRANAVFRAGSVGGSAEDVAAAIAFLASDTARAVNGLALPVHDGWSAV